MGIFNFVNAMSQSASQEVWVIGARHSDWCQIYQDRFILQKNCATELKSMYTVISRSELSSRFHAIEFTGILPVSIQIVKQSVQPSSNILAMDAV